MKIRFYEDKDYKGAQLACMDGSQDFEGSAILLNMYCNYYIEQEKENVFILANDRDEAVGYIFCAADWERYKSIYNEKYLPQLKEMSEVRYNEKCKENLMLDDIMKEYPAHLHIDILKDYRSGGYGSKLVGTLIGHLKKMQVPGLMLCVGKDNVRAHNFYEKNGFALIVENEHGRIYGIKI